MEPAGVLGGAAASHIPVIVEVLEGIGEHRYEFMSAERFEVIIGQPQVSTRLLVYSGRASPSYMNVIGLGPLV